MKTTNLSFYKKLGYTFIALMVIVVVVEIGLRLVYYQVKSDRLLAIIKSIDYLQEQNQKRKIKRTVVNVKKFFNELPDLDVVLYSKNGEKMLKQLQDEYENHFKILLNATKSVKSRLLVLYIPSGSHNIPQKWDDKRGKYCRKYFRKLTKKYNVDFLDLTDCLSREPREAVTISPENVHFSRYGNHLIAEALNKYLQMKYKGYSSFREYNGKPVLLGDLKPNTKDIWLQDPYMPYRALTNKHGLRNVRDLSVSKEKQRILVLGDSFTFGIYLPNHATYTSILESINPNLEVLNAGIIAYTILDETSLFVERAKFSAPDITVLQVLNNDLTDLFSFSKNWTARIGKGTYKPTSIENEFLERCRKIKRREK